MLEAVEPLNYPLCQCLPVGLGSLDPRGFLAQAAAKTDDPLLGVVFCCAFWASWFIHVFHAIGCLISERAAEFRRLPCSGIRLPGVSLFPMLYVSSLGVGRVDQLRVALPVGLIPAGNFGFSRSSRSEEGRELIARCPF